MSISHYSLGIACLVLATCGWACAEAPDDATVLMGALKVEEGNLEKRPGNPDSLLQDGARVANCTYKEDTAARADTRLDIHFKLTSDEGNNKILGRATYADSQRAARRALFGFLTSTTMPLGILIKTLDVSKNTFGDLCVTIKRYDPETKAVVPDDSRIYFVRGNIAISLRAIDGKLSVKDAAKAMDDLIVARTAKGNE